MKKKIVALCLVICMLAIAIVGGTLAYFTDTAEETNTFTAGKIDITLSEVEVENVDGNYVAKKDGEGEEIRLYGKEIGEENPVGQSYHLFPAMTIAKDPTITVVKNSEDAYVAAKVTVKGDLYDLIGVDGYDTINIHGLASGGLLADQAGGAYGDYNGLFVFQNDNYAIHQVADKANNTWTMYIFMKNIQPKQDADAEIVLFDTLTIPADYDNAEMEKINGMSIKVEAYATQTNGFADCYTAMTTAFVKDDGTGAFNPVKK